MEIRREPCIDWRDAQLYLGIRQVAPFAGMARAINRMSKDLTHWFRERSLSPTGPSFVRYHVIDMRGAMEITYGFPVATVFAADGIVTADTLVAGHYASLVYTGGGIAGNKALIEWARANGHAFDRWDTAQGDTFRCRYETHLTDPRTEPRKTRWETEVAIKLVDTSE